MLIKILVAIVVIIIAGSAIVSYGLREIEKEDKLDD